MSSGIHVPKALGPEPVGLELDGLEPVALGTGWCGAGSYTWNQSSVQSSFGFWLTGVPLTKS